MSSLLPNVYSIHNECDPYPTHLCSRYFKKAYPYCTIDVKDISKVSDGVCNGGIYNTISCAFDGGDCMTFNFQYPNCNNIAEPSRLGDGVCDEVYNNRDCGFDGNDCCPFSTDNFADSRLVAKANFILQKM